MNLVSSPEQELTDEWLALNSYTATADIDVKASNSSAYLLFTTITNDTTPPAFDPRTGDPVQPMSKDAFTLLAGETYWWCGKGARAHVMVG